MRTKLKGLLTGMMVFVMMLAGALVVQAASGSVTFGSNSYTKTEGEEFNVGVYVKGDVNIATYKFYINYDADKIEYVSGADSGGSGRLSFAGTMSTDSGKYKKIWLTFKAKAAGEFTMSVTDVYLGPLDVANGDSLPVSKAGSAPITIKAAGSASGVCDLKSISIAETGFYGFSADKTQYDITVENKYEKLTVTAKAADSNATVEISDTTLKVGTNYIKIKVTAQSGDSKTYTVIVRRKAGTSGETTTPTEPTTPVTPPDIPGADDLKSYYSYNDKALYFIKSLDGVTVPEGFSKVNVTVEGEEYEVLTNSSGTIVLYYLVDSAGQNGSFYVYSNAKDAVYPYVVLNNSDNAYMVDEVANPQIPEGYQKVNMVIKGVGGAEEEVSVIAWYHEDAPNFYLLYASCNGGEPALYQYDVSENTIQRFNGIKGSTQIVEGTDDSEKVKDLEKKVEKLEKEKKSEAKTWMLVVIVLAVLCIILVVIVVALFYKMRDQMEYESYDEEDDNNGYADEDNMTVSAPRAEKKNTKSDYDDDDDFTFFDMDDDR
ncbi:MAG: hypothetical protein E7261_01265 [Lachnospiraceae bacterium]|nr:hypothetical protein [Lachnospiraceae bacterium]